MEDKHGRKILFLLTSYDWMRPYAMAVLNSLMERGCHAIAVVEQKRSIGDFAHFPAGDVTVFEMPHGKVSARLFTIYPSAVAREIRRVIAVKGIELVMVLTIDIVLSRIVPRLQKRVPLLYVVHDAKPHEVVRGSLKERVNQYFIFDRPQQSLIRSTHYQVTNSLAQQEYLRRRFTRKSVYYLPFPSLVDKCVAEGTRMMPELDDVDRYILFFGKIEFYKGVHRLYEVYMADKRLHRHKLVIVGSGDIYFPTAPCDNVIVVNRYVGDDEIAELYRHAAVVVYPYVSATQSGVLSVASYFGKPMVVSDVPFFREVAAGAKGVTIVDIADDAAFADALLQSAESGESSRQLYDTAYSDYLIKKRFAEVVDDVLSAYSRNNKSR